MESSVVKVESIPAAFKAPVGLFICSASFEDRCRTLADGLDPKNVQATIVAETEHSSRYTSGHGDYLRQRFASNLFQVVVNTDSPVATADALGCALANALDNNTSIDSVLVDLTTFTHETLLILVKLLMLRVRVTPHIRIRFAYISASEYSIGDTDRDKWLSKGVGEIRSVLGYPGDPNPSRHQHLILLVGFEHERASELIKAYEPGLISLGYGRSGTATHERHDAANRHFHELVTRMAATYGEARSFEFACNNPLEAWKAIEKEVEQGEGFNTVLAPLNTKLSTLGAVLAANQNQSIQICYARANQYNYKNYSAPGENCYIVELPELFVVDDKQ